MPPTTEKLREPVSLPHAKVGGPPDDWHGVRVVDLDAGQEVTEVIECNAAEGWLVRAASDANGCFVLDGEGDETHIRYERVVGRFLILPACK